MKENPFFAGVLSIVIFSIVFVFVLVFAQNCRFTSSWQRSFISSVQYEKEKWLNADITGTIGGDNPRPGIARDLIEKKSLIGKSREEIIEMLGNGENHGIYEPNTISYSLEEIFWIIDPVAYENLIIYFDNENKVEKAEIKFYKIGG